MIQSFIKTFVYSMVAGGVVGVLWNYMSEELGTTFSAEMGFVMAAIWAILVVFLYLIEEEIKRD